MSLVRRVPTEHTDLRASSPKSASDSEALIELARRCRRLIQGIRDDRTRQVLADMAAELEERASGRDSRQYPRR